MISRVECTARPFHIAGVHAGQYSPTDMRDQMEQEVAAMTYTLLHSLTTAQFMRLAESMKQTNATVRQFHNDEISHTDLDVEIDALRIKAGDFIIEE